MKFVIVSGGRNPSLNLLKEELLNSNSVICADSGANSLYEYKIYPDYIIGDLDSIKEEALAFFKNTNTEILQYPPEKDYTDTEIAVDTAISLGAEEIVLLGCTGSRMDHLMGNLGMLLKCLRKNIVATIKDDNNLIMITDKSITLDGSSGTTFSLVAYFSDVYNLTIRGAKYLLKDYFLKIGDPITISNEFLEQKVNIEFTKGILLIIFPKD